MSEILMVIATVVIAIFAGFSWYTSIQIKKDRATRNAEVHNLFFNLTAAIMASGKTAGDPPTATRLFVEQEASLREAIEKTKKPFPSQGS